MAQAFVKRVAQNSSIVGGTTLSVVIPAAGVAQGNKVVVGFGYSDDGTGAQPTCADSKGNAYAVDGDMSMTTNGNKRLVVFSSLLTVALVNADTITVTSGNQSLRAMDVREFSGMGKAKDRVTMRQLSTSTAVTTLQTELRRLANEALVTWCLWRFTSPGDTWTAGAGFLDGNLVPADGAGVNLNLASEYQLFTVAGTDAGTGTIGPAARGWIAIQVGYCEPGVVFGQSPIAAPAEIASVAGIC